MAGSEEADHEGGFGLPAGEVGVVEDGVELDKKMY